jgi:ankyrin repeat protein
MFFGLFGGANKRAAELYEAASKGDLEGVRKALDKDADINALEPKYAETALHAAVDHAHAAVVDLLLAKGANPDIISNQGYTPLIIAAAKGDDCLSILDLLIAGKAHLDLAPASGDNAGGTPLHVAASVGANKTLRRLLAAGARVDLRQPNQATALHTAALGGNAETIAMLIDSGISIGVTTKQEQTPLHYAAISGNEKAAKSLLDHGATLESRDFEGMPPLLKAVFNNRPNVVKLLLERGAYFECVAKSGKSEMNSLYGAAINGYDEVVKLLLKAGANVEKTIGEYPSVIEMAKAAGHESIVKLLTAARKRQRAEAGTSEDSQPKAAKSKTKRSALKIELGIWCSNMRYSEEEHGRNLPADFKKAQAAWVKSGNELTSPPYQEACRLLSKWFESNFAIRFGLSMSMDVTADNEMGDAKEIKFKDASEAAEYAFRKQPKAKSLAVTAVDFRGSASSDWLKEDEKLLRSPDVGIVAVFQADLVDEFDTPAAFATWLETNGDLIRESFTLNIKDKAIETTVTDDEGETYTSTNASWSGGDIHLEVNQGQSTEEFIHALADKVMSERTSPALLGESVHRLKPLFMKADEEAIHAELAAGLDSNDRIDNEPLVKYALMIAATANQWFNSDELGETLQAKYASVTEYKAALKRIAIDLLEHGADVNAQAGHISILGVATTLEDPELLQRCLAKADTANDVNSTPFLLAAERGDVESMRVFLGKEARINKREFMHGTTPLMIAAQGPGGEDAAPLSGAEATRQEAAVVFLLDNGAEIDSVSDMGDTAIGNAVRRGNVGIVKLLLERGAGTKEALPRNQRLIDLAKERGHKEIIALLAARA